MLLTGESWGSMNRNERGGGGSQGAVPPNTEFPTLPEPWLLTKATSALTVAQWPSDPVTDPSMPAWS